MALHVFTNAGLLRCVMDFCPGVRYGDWTSATKAAAAGHLFLLQTKKLRYFDGYPMDQAAKYGRLDVMQYFVDAKKPVTPTPDVLRKALHSDRAYDVIRFLHKHYPHMFNDIKSITDLATEHPDALRICKFFNEAYGVMPSLPRVLQSGNIDLFNWMSPHEYYMEHVFNAVQGNNLEIFLRVYDTMKMQLEFAHVLCLSALTAGACNIVRHLHELTRVVFNGSHLVVAIESGSLETVQFIVERGVVPGREDFLLAVHTGYNDIAYYVYRDTFNLNLGDFMLVSVMPNDMALDIYKRQRTNIKQSGYPFHPYVEEITSNVLRCPELVRLLDEDYGEGARVALNRNNYSLSCDHISSAEEVESIAFLLEKGYNVFWLFGLISLAKSNATLIPRFIDVLEANVANLDYYNVFRAVDSYADLAVLKYLYNRFSPENVATLKNAMLKLDPFSPKNVETLRWLMEVSNVYTKSIMCSVASQAYDGDIELLEFACSLPGAEDSLPFNWTKDPFVMDFLWARGFRPQRSVWQDAISMCRFEAVVWLHEHDVPHNNRTVIHAVGCKFYHIATYLIEIGHDTLIGVMRDCKRNGITTFPDIYLTKKDAAWIRKETKSCAKKAAQAV